MEMKRDTLTGESEMKPYSKMTKEELRTLQTELKAKYRDAQQLNLNLNMK